MKELLDLLATWERLSGERHSEANRLGPGKAGEVRATEAGVLGQCAAELRQVIAQLAPHTGGTICGRCGQHHTERSAGALND